MSLPRILVHVDDRAGGGWTVRIAPEVDPPPFVSSFAMDSAPVDVGGFERRVPVVPEDRRPPAGAEHSALSHGDTAAISALLSSIAMASTEDDDVRIYGRWLFECLIAPAWQQVCSFAPVRQAHGVELALTWPTASDLHGLVWEAMHDGTDHLAANRGLLVAITRVVPSTAESPRTLARPPRVLFAAGSPLADEVIRPGAMFMGLLRMLDAEGKCVTRAVQAVSIDDLAAECRAFEPDVVHLVAHGDTLPPDGKGVLLLAGCGHDGVGAEELKHALMAGRQPPIAVAISACHSGGGTPAGPSAIDWIPGDDDGADADAETVAVCAAPLAAELVAAGIPIVSAMAGAVSEQACRLYTRRLVDAIHRGEPLVKAAAEGRAAALLHARRSHGLDWAMPAIFLAPSVKPDFLPVDGAIGQRIVDIADGLDLRWQPVFIGRYEIFKLLDDIFSDQVSRRLRFMGIWGGGSLSGLGGSRLLREIGFRLLREGHVPLPVIGPFAAGNNPGGSPSVGPPDSLRAVLVQIFEQAVKVTELLELPPAPISALGADSSFEDADKVTAEGLAALSPDDARQRVLETLDSFASRTQVLKPLLVRGRLAADLAELARMAAGAGEPFGRHTRVVVLAADAHLWVDAVGPLLAMINASGLGTTDFPVPVIATFSLTEGDGRKLADFRCEKTGKSEFVFPELTTLRDAEAALGFQWVLLHPWRRDQQDDRMVYVAAPTTKPAESEKALKRLEGKPANVRHDLYLVARVLSDVAKFLADDDEAAYAKYVESHP